MNPEMEKFINNMAPQQKRAQYFLNPAPNKILRRNRHLNCHSKLGHGGHLAWGAEPDKDYSVLAIRDVER